MTTPHHFSPPPAHAAHARATALHGPKFQHNPGQLYRDMRRQHGPVAPVLLDGDIPAWLVLGYRELLHVTGNPQLYARDPRRWNAWDKVPPDWPLLPLFAYQPSMLFAEGPEHRRRADAVSDALSQIDPFELRMECERISDRLIDTFAGTGEADLTAQYAAPIPLLAVAKMCGMSDAGATTLVRDMGIAFDGGADALEAFGRVRGAVAQLVDSRRAHPGPDVTSRLLEDAAALTNDEIVNDIVVVMNTGQLPTSIWIGNTIRLMLTDDRFALALSGGRNSIGQALNEVLWEDTPTQNMAGRFATQDTYLSGQRIRAGDLLILGLAAANADADIRSRSCPDSVGNRAHMSFSHGEHRCVYPAPELAEVIARTAIEVLLDRLPDVTLAVSPDALVWRPSVWMRGLSALPVQFTPTSAPNPASSKF